MTLLPPPRIMEGPTASAAVYDHGAHLTSWTPAGERDVLFLSSAAVLDDSAAIRGGVPICFPWFGPGRTGDMVPAHGFARRTAWTLVGIDVQADRSVVTYALDDSMVAADQVTQPFRAAYRIGIGRSLDLALTVENTGGEVFSFEEALHTYLEVGDIRQTSIVGLDRAPFTDKAAGGAQRMQAGAIRFAGETDRVYRSAADVVVVDPVLRRSIAVARRDSSDLVVWNPGADLVIGDLGAGEWRRFVCVEAANVRDAAVHLAPGAQHTMGVSFRLA